MDDYDFESSFWGNTEPNSRKKKIKRKKKWRGKFPLFVLVALLFVAMGFTGYQLADTWLTGSFNIAGGSQPAAAGEQWGEEAAAADEDSDILTLLMMGVDKRGNEPSRADTIITAFINLDTKEVNLLSIPRDTYVSVPGHERTKINHAHSYGGPELMIETVSEFLDVPINKYVELDFEGFTNVVDTLGGVELEVKQRMYYPSEGIDLYEGMQELDGKKALEYVRYRGKTGDIGRVERQQKFLKNILNQSVSIGNVVKVPAIVKEVKGSTSTNLSVKEMLGLAKIAKDVDTEKIDTATVPGESTYINEVNYWRPYNQKTMEIVEKFLARNGD